MAAAGYTIAGGDQHAAYYVATKFVDQYFRLLEAQPEMVHKFYQDGSWFSRPDGDGNMIAISTMAEIDEKVRSMGHCAWTVKTMDAQASLGNGVMVLVKGYMTGMDKVNRDFTQSIFLAPHQTGFYVLNDILRFERKEDRHQDCPEYPMGKGEHGAHCKNSGASQRQNGHVAEHKPAESIEEAEASTEEPHSLSNGVKHLIVEEEAPISKDRGVIDVSLDSFPPMVAKTSSSSALKETPKKSYASILSGIEEDVRTSDPAKPPVWPITRKTEKHIDPHPAPVSKFNVATSNSKSDGKRFTLETEVDGHSVYLKGLPVDVTATQIEDELRKFGPIKRNGIQFRSNKLQGFCYGYVEFEVVSAVQNAIKASPIFIDGRRVYIHEKRAINSRASNRGRFEHSLEGGGLGLGHHPLGVGVGGRGRGSYDGGINNSRRDFHSKPDISGKAAGGTETD